MTPESRHRQLSGWREAIPAGAAVRHHKSDWRRRQAFSTAVGGWRRAVNF